VLEEIIAPAEVFAASRMIALVGFLVRMYRTNVPLEMLSTLETLSASIDLADV